MKPLIGIPTRPYVTEDVTFSAIATTYTNALDRAGAAPVLIPLGLGEDTLTAILSRLDGLLLAGGVDVHPSEYGEPVEPFCGAITRDRDLVELPLIRRAWQDKKPMLGICRGIQMMNVAAGGSLYQDIPAQLPGALHHSHVPGDPYSRRAHSIEIEPASELARILGPSAQVNSLHHQSLKDIAPGLRVIARAPDGVVEAVQADDRFALGLQFHPEWLVDDEQMLRIFQRFVDAAKEPRAG